jgi:poly(glycerol-phosphate) alpha-glucosyltransferase
MTSRFEGYPLATLEALSRGCPVLAYDVKYGPREQITDGVDGWVVPAKDRQAMADRIVELARDPERVARMSLAARETAARHDAAAFVRDWKTVLDAVVAAKPRRTTLDDVRLRVRRLGTRPARHLPATFSRVPVLRRWARGRAGAGAWRTPGTMELRATLRVTGSSSGSTLDSAVVSLDAVDDRTGAVVPVPLTVVRSDGVFRLSAVVDIGGVFAAAATARHLRLRLRLVWENSAWETTIKRPRGMAPNYEVSYAPSGELTLGHRR